MRWIATLLLQFLFGCNSVQPQLEATVDAKHDGKRMTPRLTMKLTLAEARPGSPAD